jgi:hypothetical protein
MRTFIYSMLLLGLMLPSCGHKPPEKTVDLNAGKHKLADRDPRSWASYPVLLLVSTKYHVGIDTAAQIIKQFDARFDGDGADFEPTIPSVSIEYEEDTHPIAEDKDFFMTQAKRTRLPVTTVASLITEFYLLGGSNREYPESVK